MTETRRFFSVAVLSMPSYWRGGFRDAAVESLVEGSTFRAALSPPLFAEVTGLPSFSFSCREDFGG